MPSQPTGRRLPPSPVSTPVAASAEIAAWAMETPTPSGAPATESTKPQPRDREDPFNLASYEAGATVEADQPAEEPSVSQSEASATWEGQDAANREPRRATHRLPTTRVRVSKSALRQVCKPFFDEMLDAVFEALQNGALSLSEQSDEEGLEGEGSSPGLSIEVLPPCEETQVRSKGISRPPGQHTAGRPAPRHDPQAEATADAGAGPAVAAVASAACHRAFDSGDSSSKTGPNWTSDSQAASAGAFPGFMSKRSSHSASVVSTRSSEKGQLMGVRGVFAKSQHVAKDPVCIHWKTKGWCRYNDQCKFDHPPALRGVEAVPMSGLHCMVSPMSAVSSGLPSSSSFPFGQQQQQQLLHQQTHQNHPMQHQQQPQMQQQQQQQQLNTLSQLSLPQQQPPQQQQQLFQAPSTMPMNQTPLPQQQQQQPQQQQQGYQVQFAGGSSPMSMPIVIAGMAPDGTLLGGFSCQQGMVPRC